MFKTPSIKLIVCNFRTMDYLIDLDREIFTLLNGIHHPILDFFMFWISEKWAMLPLYAVLLTLLAITYKKKMFLIIPVIAIMITITDQTCNAFKKGVERPRPCREEAQLDPPARTLDDYHCSRYGFFSAHAASSFAAAIFLTGLLKRRFKKVGWILIPWAITTAYSRIYLGVHYPLDVITGAVFGILVSTVMLKIFHTVEVKLFK